MSVEGINKLIEGYMNDGLPLNNNFITMLQLELEEVKDDSDESRVKLWKDKARNCLEALQNEQKLNLQYIKEKQSTLVADRVKVIDGIPATKFRTDNGTYIIPIVITSVLYETISHCTKDPIISGYFEHRPVYRVGSDCDNDRDSGIWWTKKKNYSSCVLYIDTDTHAYKSYKDLSPI